MALSAGRARKHFHQGGGQVAELSLSPTKLARAVSRMDGASVTTPSGPLLSFVVHQQFFVLTYEYKIVAPPWFFGNASVLEPFLSQKHGTRHKTPKSHGRGWWDGGGCLA
jgi:hypothetical protein